MKSRALMAMMVLAGTMGHRNFPMFPTIRDETPYPTAPKVTTNEMTRAESYRRCQAAQEKRAKRAAKLIKQHGSKWTEFVFNDERWAYSSDELARWDDELGYDFHSFHELANPTKDTVISYLRGLK